MEVLWLIIDHLFANLLLLLFAFGPVAVARATTTVGDLYSSSSTFGAVAAACATTATGDSYSSLSNKAEVRGFRILLLLVSVRFRRLLRIRSPGKDSGFLRT